MRPHNNKKKNFPKGSGKLEENLLFGLKGSGAPHRTCIDRRLTLKEMAIIKRDDAVRNSRIKRGLVKEGVRSQHVLCGCGAEGCIFVSVWQS